MEKKISDPINHNNLQTIGEILKYILQATGGDNIKTRGILSTP